MSSEVDQDIDSVFGVEPEDLDGIADQNGDRSGGVADQKGWDFGASDTLSGVEVNGAGGNEELAPAEDDEVWSFSGEGKEEAVEDAFGVEGDIGEVGFNGLGDGVAEGIEKSELEKQLESEEKSLIAVLKGVLFHPYCYYLSSVVVCVCFDNV